MTSSRVVLPSLSAAMDGGFTAIADVSGAMASSGTTEQHRLIGGVAVMLHVERLGLHLPLRATGDADFGVPPHVLRRPDLVDEALGTVVLPDAVGMLALKTLVRTVRTEARDVEDLWRCLEIAAADGVEPATFDASEPLRRVRRRCGASSGPTASRLVR